MWWSAASLTLFLFVGLPPPLARKDQYGVSAQLYTYLDFLAHAMDFPLQKVDPVDFSKPEYKKIGDEELDDSGELKKFITCLAKIPEDFGGNDYDKYKYGIEGWDYFRTDVDGNFNNKYFCANVPNPKVDFDHNDGLNATSTTAGIRGPHTLFWLNEPTSWHWHWRWTTSGADRGFINMLAKRYGILFVIEVTGIKSGGRFLKGWFHLKITLDLDQNLYYSYPEQSPKLRHYVYMDWFNALEVDKLMVTARGRTLVPGRPIEGEMHPPRRAWVGGIGEFVKDFPRCIEKGYNKKYVTQQFMDCPNVQFQETLHGNNFYYTRTENDAKTKYGQTQHSLGSNGRMEIHLNYKLDNSLCNKYYDLDFVANGIVRNKLGSGLDNPAKKLERSPEVDQYLFYNVQRSVSTRFVFSSSHGAHFPTFYENADPIPRGVDNVVCSDPLVAEWEVNDDKSKFTKLEDHSRTKHRVAVTRGADLKLTNTKDGLPPPTDASFGGAIKFIYTLPSNFQAFTPPIYLDKTKIKQGEPKTNVDPGFTAHRTFTYQDRLMLKIDSVSKFHNEEQRNEASPYNEWKDEYEYPKKEIPTKTMTPNQVRSRIIASIQRVLNEFDWETWRANADDVNPEVSGLKPWVGIERCSNVFAGKDDDEMKNWPHPYYDATCTTVDAQHVPRENLNNPVDFYEAYLRRSKTSFKSVGASKWGETLPVIVGRCNPGLWYSNLAAATPSHGNVPRPCNFFYNASRMGKTLDPALGIMVKMVDAQIGSGRLDWDKKYLKTPSKYLFQCLVVNKLREEYPDCPRIKPRPWTPRPTVNLTKEDIKEFKNVEKWEENAKKKFLKSNSYPRGILAAEDPFTLYVWDSRLIHGIFMTIITMFITPISIFMTRYFKETFMNSRIFLHRIWFFIHISASFMTALLFLVGMWRQTESRGILGVSLSRSALAHRIMGWLSVTICLLLVFFGAFRCMEKMLRAVIIIMHSLMGILFYIFCLACMITANAIPGSPAAYNDFAVHKFSGANLAKEGVLITVIIWIIFDIGMHTAMTILQCMHDRNMKLTSARLYLLSPMPILTETERFDVPGRFARIYMLTAYIAVAILGTVTICFLIFSHSPREKGLGFMSCTHQFKNNTMRQEYDC